MYRLRKMDANEIHASSLLMNTYQMSVLLAEYAHSSHAPYGGRQMDRHDADRVVHLEALEQRQDGDGERGRHAADDQRMPRSRHGAHC